MVNNPAGGAGGTQEDLKFIAIGGAGLVGAFLLLGMLRNRNAAGTTTPATTGTSGTSGQPQTVYVPVNGPTDIVASDTTDSYNQGSSIVNLPTATDVSAPITTSGGTVTASSGPGGINSPVTNPSPTPIVILPPPPPPPPPHVPADPIHPHPIHPWWWSMLHTGHGSDWPTYYTSTGQTVNQIASMFGVSWQDLAYNPHNQGLTGGTFLHDSFINHGNNHVPAGTDVWITTSLIPATKPA